MRSILIVFLFSLITVTTFGQTTFSENEVRDIRHTTYAFTHATVIVSPEETLNNATLLVRDGKIVAVAEFLEVPQEAVTVDLEGKYIYPSFIDLYTDYGMPEVESGKKSGTPQYNTSRKAPYGANDALHTERLAAETFAIDKKQAEVLRKSGFGAVLTQQHDGILRGEASLVQLGEESPNKMVLQPHAATGFSFDKGSSKQQYPNSLMGAIALVRQTIYDARWYAGQKNPKERNLTLSHFNTSSELPAIFAVDDYLTGLRVGQIAEEFEQPFIIKGAGDEYKRAYDIKAANAAYILPLNFPKAYKIRDPYDALFIELEQLKHWEQAPTNPKVLAEMNVPFTFTMDGLEKPDDFLKNLRKAVSAGLSEQDALAALSLTPAQLIGQEKQLGTLESGKLANFFIATGNIFKKETKILENWVNGKPYTVKNLDEVSLAGEYIMNLNNSQFQLKVKDENGKVKATISQQGQKEEELNIERNNDLITLSFNWKDDLLKGPVRLSGKVNYKSKIWDGRGQDGAGNWMVWSAIRQGSAVMKSDTTNSILVEGKTWYPNGAYGWKELPEREDFIIKNATIWSCDSAGVFVGDVIVKDGKIETVGTHLEFDKKLKVINGKGLHLTPGIVDEHSHIAISKGVNEGTYNSSAMVRIGDVVNPEDVNIYRQLSGGVTTSQLLHGSANPIGGQSAIIKLKWGYSPEAMKIENAPGFIKFALGENVKQSNWGDRNSVRFPQTRMGVEQVYYDRFYRAVEYDSLWQNYRAEKKRITVKKIPGIRELTGYENPSPRKDLELDALVEILHNERYITCHSYVQSEINMLLHVADSLHIKVNTFTHVLEGYKVADKLKAHEANASTFSDWWAYKYEVRDAIPYNAAILHGQGVNTGINSDDAEMGRRLNQEAAKTIKYGGVSEEEALKMVTINPAKMLHLDDRIGSITAGKDADFVLWTDHPLSIYAQVQQTYIEGIPFFDRDRDTQMREAIQNERARIITKMLKAIESGESTQETKKKEHKLYECETISDDYIHE